jgi:2-desacetyl-2-hydroxyethyl bacteriochlorophyllide A dehydrogenase
MKAAVFYGKHDVRVQDVQELTLGPRDVRIKIAYCGVCGTDIHIYEGDPGAAPVTPPNILGHEMSGVVSETGKDVTQVKTGDRVAVDPNEMCGQCFYCRNAMGHFCTRMTGYGTTARGGFAEFLTVPEKQVYKIPDHMPLKNAALSETVSCCVHGIDLCKIRAGQTVLVIGAGPIGLIMLQLAKLQGAAYIIVSEPTAQKRELALKLGADIAVDPTREDLKSILAGYPNVDCVIECVGSVKTMAQAVELAGRGATVMFFGLTPPNAELAIKPYDVFARELHITASFINPYTFTRAISLLAEVKINVRDIISLELALDDILRVFEEPACRQGGKVLIKMGAEGK